MVDLSSPSVSSVNVPAVVILKLDVLGPLVSHDLSYGSWFKAGIQEANHMIPVCCICLHTDSLHVHFFFCFLRDLHFTASSPPGGHVSLVHSNSLGWPK